MSQPDYIDYNDWGLGLVILIGDWGLRWGIGIGDWDGDWDWD